MAILTGLEIQEFITALNRNITPQTWDKPQLTAALQAIENRMRAPASLNALSSDIEAAAPGVFTTEQKYTLFGVWCVSAARRLGVL